MMQDWQEAQFPFASEDERSLIGSLLFEPSCIPATLKTVGTNDFGDQALRAIFASIVRRYRESGDDGQALAAMVLQDIKGSPAVDDAHALLTMIAESVVTAAHAPTFAKSVSDAAKKRRLIDAAQTAIKGASNGQTADDVLADLLEFAATEARSGEDRTPFPRMTLAELREKHPEQRPPVVEGLIREGQTMNIIGAPKIGKSWMVYGLLLSIANNERWLGRFDVQPGKVWLIDNELHREDIVWRLDTVADAMGIPRETVEREIVVTSLRGNMRSLQELDTSAIEPGEFKLIVGDAAYRFATVDGDENSNTDQTKFYNLVDQIAAKTEAAVALVHHSSKGDQSGKAVTDVGAGAGAQSRAADAHLIVRKHEENECFVLDAAVRSFAPVQPITLRWGFPVWIPDEQLDPTRLAGRLGKGQQAKVEEDQQGKALVRQKLASQRLTNKQLRKLVGMGRERLGRILDVMESEGVVGSETVLRRGNECEQFYLVQDVDDVDGPRPVHVGGGAGGLCVAAPKGGPSTPVHPGPGPGPEGFESDSATAPVHVQGKPFPEFLDHAEGVA